MREGTRGSTTVAEKETLSLREEGIEQGLEDQQEEQCQEPSHEEEDAHSRENLRRAKRTFPAQVPDNERENKLA